MKTILLLLSPFLCALVAVSCGGAPENDPMSVTKAFWHAAMSKDLSTMKSLSTAEASKMYDSGMSMSPQGDEGDLSYGTVTESGETATVEVIDAASDGFGTILTYLVKEDGEWKVNPMQTIQALLLKQQQGK